MSLIIRIAVPILIAALFVVWFIGGRAFYKHVLDPRFVKPAEELSPTLGAIALSIAMAIGGFWVLLWPAYVIWERSKRRNRGSADPEGHDKS
jgi:hypothetical protein